MKTTLSEVTSQEGYQADDEDFDDDALFDADAADVGPMSIYALPFAFLDSLGADLAEVDLKGIARSILHFGAESEKQSRATIESGAQAIILAWACGTALNIAKTKLPHGKFGPWRTDLLKTALFDVRTAQRYMELAKKFTCLKKLLAWNPTLRQAYLACQIFPAPTKSEKPVDKNFDARARIGLLKSVASVQKKLLMFGSKNVSIDDDTRKELLAAKSEIDQLFSNLIGEKRHM